MPNATPDPVLKAIRDTIKEELLPNIVDNKVKHDERNQSDFIIDFSNCTQSLTNESIIYIRLHRKDRSVNALDKILTKKIDSNDCINTMCDSIIFYKEVDNNKAKYYAIALEYKDTVNNEIEKGKMQAINGVLLIQYILNVIKVHRLENKLPNFKFGYFVMIRPSQKQPSRSINDRLLFQDKDSSTEL